MAGIAGTLSLSLIVTTPSNAQAFLPAPLLPGVWGATTMVIPQLMPVASTLGPIGWGALAVGAIGLGLYSSRDYWLPYVTGDFGKTPSSCAVGDFCGSGGSSTIPDPTASATPSPSPSPTETVAGAGTPDANITIRNPRIAPDNGRDILWDATFSSPAGSFTTYSYAWMKECTYPDGRVVPTSGHGNPKNVQVGTTTPRLTCTYTQGAYTYTGTITAFKAGLPGFDGLPVLPSGWTGSPRGPSTVVVFGRFSPGDIDPRTDATKYTTTVECVKPDGSFVEISAESLGGAGGLTVPSCAAAGLGHGTGKTRVDGFLDGSQQPTKLWDVPRADSDPAMPLCDAKRPGSGCKLGVSLDGKPCVIGNIECENWTDLRNDPNHSTRLSCQYGPYAVSIETCNPLERAYEPGGAPATDANTDGNPNTRDDTQPDGSTQPKPSTDPNAPPATGTAPGTGGFPITGTNPSPSTSPNCASPTWSWNPVDFVKSPVMCALQDAFVPKQDIQARSDQLRQKSLDTVPIAWLSPSVTGPGGGGCPNWTINVAGLSKNVICDSSFTQALLGVRTPLFGLVAAAMVWPLIRGIWYAAIPVLRVSPGSHK